MATSISRKMADLLNRRREAARALRAVPTDVMHGKEKAVLIEVNARLRQGVRRKRRWVASSVILRAVALGNYCSDAGRLESSRCRPLEVFLSLP